MARTVDTEAHAVRRDTFVDAAQRLMQAKGYEQISIQDVLDEVGASRGAFYHYFASKTDLLEAVVTRIVDTALASVAPVVDDPALDAAAKLEGLFGGIAQWKMERTELMLALVRVWLSDENTLMRDKMWRRLDAASGAGAGAHRRAGRRGGCLLRLVARQRPPGSWSRSCTD